MRGVATVTGSASLSANRAQLLLVAVALMFAAFWLRSWSLPYVAAAGVAIVVLTVLVIRRQPRMRSLWWPLLIALWGVLMTSAHAQLRLREVRLETSAERAARAAEAAKTAAQTVSRSMDELQSVAE